MHRSPLFRSVCVGAALLVASLAHAGPYTSMFVFGDSLSDVGNVLKESGGLIPPPIYSGISPYSGAFTSGAFTNGAPWVNGVAQALGLADLTPSYPPLPNPPYTPPASPLPHGNDYAWGGARTDRHFNSVLDGTGSIQGQVGSFLTDHGGTADPGALYVLWGGANDLQDALLIARNAYVAAITAGASPADAQQIAIGSVTANVFGSVGRIGGLLDALIGAGAHTLVVPNLPALGLAPRIAAFSPLGVSLGNYASALFNGLLDGVLAARSGSADLREVDIFGLFNDAVAHPGNYGFSNVTQPCFTGDEFGTPGGMCTNPDPDAYLFWDSIHPTQAAHTYIAAAIADVAIPAPGVLLLFGIGGAGLLAARRARPAATSPWA